MPHENAMEWIAEDWAESHEFSLQEEIENRLATGQEPAVIAAEMAAEIGTIEREVIDKQPDAGHNETVTMSDVGALIQNLAEREAEKRSESSADSYMPTADPTNVTPSSTGGDNPGDSDNGTLTRFQTQAAAKERALAEGFNEAGDRLKLFEISERLATQGETIRWEIRNCDGGESIMEGGPLLLDHPQHSDHALADARGRAYAALRDLCNGAYRDLRAAIKFQGEVKMDITSKKALLAEQVKGLTLTAAQRILVADIESQIGDLSDEFITSVGGIMKQDWDAGSSWEVVEADGTSKLVRKVTKLDDDVPTKHAFRAGQTLRIDSGVVPDDIVVIERLGDSRYKVRSLLSHAVFNIDEADAYDPEGSDPMFEGGLGIPDIANLF